MGILICWFVLHISRLPPTPKHLRNRPSQSTSFPVCAAIGLQYNFFFAMHLFKAVSMFPALSNVIRAVTIPARTLALTFALFVIVIYTFTLLGFNYFREFTGHSKGSCGSLLECFLTMMHAGLLNGAGAVIAQDIVYEYSAWSRDAGMAAFDWLFWVFVTIVLLNCVFGIMLDTFAFLRDQQARQREIIEKYCFICCEPIGSFESKAKYNIHQQFEHNLLNYVFFIYHGA